MKTKRGTARRSARGARRRTVLLARKAKLRRVGRKGAGRTRIRSGRGKGARYLRQKRLRRRVRRIRPAGPVSVTPAVQPLPAPEVVPLPPELGVAPDTPEADAYQQGYSEAYNVGFDAGFSKGFEEGHKLDFS